MRAARLWKHIVSSVDKHTVDVFASAVDRRRDRKRRFVNQRHLRTVISQLQSISKQHSSISYEAFLQLCSRICGEQKSEHLAEMCYQHGYVWRLGRRVYTAPERADLISGLSIYSSSFACKVQKLKTEFHASEQRRQELNTIARAGTRRTFMVGLMVFVFQWMLFIRLTYVEYSWDIMEPVAYFTTMFLTLASYGYFLLTYARPKYAQVSHKMLELRRDLLFKEAGFDIDRHRLLKHRVGVYERYLRDRQGEATEHKSDKRKSSLQT